MDLPQGESIYLRGDTERVLYTRRLLPFNYLLARFTIAHNEYITPAECIREISFPSAVFY